jgi:CRISPR-associated protein Cmr3
MNYKITLTPLEPFLFGGDNTFGKIGDKENSTYLVKGRQFPQQSAILGMLKKQIMIQSGVLTRKVRGEWVDKNIKNKAIKLVGNEKFSMTLKELQNFGLIKKISPIYLQRKDERFIKKVNIDSFTYQDKLLKGYNLKQDIYDNFISTDGCKRLRSKHIFKPIEQTGNKIGGEDNSLFKKTSYLLKHNFKFAFYLECEYELKDSIITLGADGSKFKMEVFQSDEKLDYKDKNGYLTLLSDAYITVSLKGNCEFAITSEISYQNLQNKKHSTIKNEFKKSTKIYLYEKGSVFINPEDELINNLNNRNCQKIGYNTYSYKGQNS